MTETGPAVFSRRTALTIAIGWTGIIVLILSLPVSSLPDTTLWEYDKIGHAGIFFVLALVWMNGLSAYRVRTVLFVVVCGLILAPLSEWYQSVLPLGRIADDYDSLADAVGFALGTMVWVLFVSQKRGWKLPGNFQD